jgi:hypothetical protein
VNEELAARYLLHVKNDRDRDDIFTLAVLPGVAEDSERDAEWYFRRRSWNSTSVGVLHEKEKFRDRILAKTWGEADWRSRLRELERKYALVADGDLHPTIRRFFRSSWRNAPPAGLMPVVDKLIDTLNMLRPVQGTYNQTWVTWATWRINLDQWRADGNDADQLARALIVGRAHGLDVSELDNALFELGDHAAQYRTFAVGDDISESGLPKFTDQWTPFEKACLALLRGLETAEKAVQGKDAGAHSDQTLAAFEFLDAALNSLWNSLPEERMKSVSEIYLRTVTMTTSEDRRPDVLRRSIELSQSLHLPVSTWWAGLLHNEKRYD